MRIALSIRHCGLVLAFSLLASSPHAEAIRKFELPDSHHLELRYQSETRSDLLLPGNAQDPGQAEHDIRMDLSGFQLKSAFRTQTDPLEFEESDSRTTLTDMAAGLGYRFDFLEEKLSLTPTLGLSYHAEEATGTLLSPPDTGLLPSLDWQGWWVGLDLSIEPMETTRLESSLVFHNAEAKDGPDPVSPDAPGSEFHEGTVFRIGVHQKLTESWSAAFLYSWEHWLGDGTLQSTPLSPDDPVLYDWTGQEVNVSLRYGF